MLNHCLVVLCCFFLKYIFVDLRGREREKGRNFNDERESLIGGFCMPHTGD